ncbi:MAG: hypothetical protein DSM107014_11050 [Gomphosphaeria aponina SAG 52.96 = DSM 107014]|uniref:Uncharacterized protein n=1 Tax=Gomphosphaeria aponina SAG 52.96 = DSM 107014 TaxID=1521640 RepID=A0A941JSH5_9CHRO|nr:hypothetical protein [Gomphosphaeria aponina SAG 52.96 = DSM 107014]
MALFGLFGNKTKYVDEPDNDNNGSTDNEESFFLNSDDAKTLGNIEYMRKTITIRRTFPKMKNGKGAEVIKEISSMKIEKSSGSMKTSTPQPQQPAQTPASSNTKPIPSSSNMDVFRKMARELKK